MDQKSIMIQDLPIPSNEKERLEALASYGIMDSEPEERLDNLTKLAAEICEVPICLISLVDENRQWFKSKVGLGAEQTPREISFCQYAIMDVEIFEVENAKKDQRFTDNVLVNDDPNIRFYAGKPLIDDDGFALGTLCVIDEKPKKLKESQRRALEILAGEVISEIQAKKHREERDKYMKFFGMSLDMLCIVGADGHFKAVNPVFEKVLGWSREELMAKTYMEFVYPDDIHETSLQIQKLYGGTKMIGFENRFIKKDGGVVWMHWTCHPDENTGDLYAVAHDISELKKASVSLEILQQENASELNAIDQAVIRLELSPDGEILNINDNFIDTVGYGSELIGKHHSILMFDEDKESDDYIQFWEDLKDNIAQQKEFRRKSKSGTAIWIKGSYIPITNEKGEVMKIIKLAYDITSRIEIDELYEKTKRIGDFNEALELKIKERTNEITDIQFALDESAIVAITDHKGIISFVNEKFESISKYTKEELLGQDHRILNSGHHSKEFMKELWKTIANGKVWKGTIKNKAKDGTFYWVDTTIVPFKNEDGKPYQYVAIRHDVTKEKELLEELSYLSNFQNGLLNGTNHSIIATNPEGTIVSFNKGAEDLLGYAAEELINKESPAILHDINEIVERSQVLTEELGVDIPPGFDVFVYKARELGVADDNEWTYIRKDGKRIPMFLSITALRNSSDELIGYLGIGTDITERQAFVQEIQAKNKELDQFAYIVTHDLKAPLRAISTLSDFIEEDLEGKLEDDVLRNFEMLKSRVTRMEGLINGILEYSRIGRITVKKERFSTTEAVDDVISGIEMKPNFEIVVDNKMPEIEYNRIQFEQVMQNLVGNGFKYHDKESGTVEVKYKDLGDFHEFSVIDDGPGIEEKYHDRIFTIFQTLQSRDEIESTGVGLSIVKKIIEEYGGIIRVESELGKGSKFIFTVPK